MIDSVYIDVNTINNKGIIETQNLTFDVAMNLFITQMYTT